MKDENDTRTGELPVTAGKNAPNRLRAFDFRASLYGVRRRARNPPTRQFRSTWLRWCRSLRLHEIGAFQRVEFARCWQWVGYPVDSLKTVIGKSSTHTNTSSEHEDRRSNDSGIYPRRNAKNGKKYRNKCRSGFNENFDRS
jgi:hypothetical protein